MGWVGDFPRICAMFVTEKQMAFPHPQRRPCGALRHISRAPSAHLRNDMRNHEEFKGPAGKSPSHKLPTLWLRGGTCHCFEGSANTKKSGIPQLWEGSHVCHVECRYG